MPHPPTGREPVDPDIDLHDRSQRLELSRHPWTLPMIALGGMAGASARYALEVAWPHADSGMPWATLLTNVSGCLLIGAVMVAVTEAGHRHRWWRPVLGVGVLGGYTTFSTYAVQALQAIQAGSSALALTYLVGTLAAALVAVTIGSIAARGLLTATRRRHRVAGDAGDRNEPTGA